MLFILFSVTIFGVILDLTGFFFSLNSSLDDLNDDIHDAKKDIYFNAGTKRILEAWGFILFFLAVGYVYFSQVEGLSHVDALYASVVGMSTVGYSQKGKTRLFK